MMGDATLPGPPRARRRWSRAAAALVLLPAVIAPSVAAAQASTLCGRVLDAATSAPLSGAEHAPSAAARAELEAAA